MSLEEDIQQRSFKSPQQKLAINLLYTSNWLNAHYSQLFKDSDITVQQFNVLRILRGQNLKPCTLKLIKERMLDRMSDASRIVDKLVAKSYVLRKQCPEDRRSVNIVISEKGLELLKKLDFVDDASKELFHRLNDNQVISLNNLLDELRGSPKN